MSAFTSAMDAPRTQMGTKHRIGENGSLELTAAGVGDSLVALFFKLTRGVYEQSIAELVAACIQEAAGDANALADLVVLAFQTRATRGLGKGEKDATYALLRQLDEDAVIATLKLMPLFGYWKDLLLIVERASDKVAAAALAIYAEQLAADDAALKAAAADPEKRTPKLTLAAKWAPREGGSLDSKLRLARKLAVAMFGSANLNASARKYRQLLSRCNAALCTTEVLMAAGRWAEIEFARVSSLCLQRHRKAFLNETLKGRVLPLQDETGNRRPEDEGRVAARKNLRRTLATGKVKGKQLQPHEIASKLMKGGLSTCEVDLMEAQWASMKEGVVEALATAAAAREEAVAEANGSGLEDVRALWAALPRRANPRAVDLGKLVALVDVSGSMSGQPMQAAIGLGLLTAELTAPAFRNRILTFESQPSWVDLSGCNSLAEKVQAIKRAPWGGSTDFKAALELILGVCEQHKLKPDEIPDLIVYSDMQFDAASPSPWSTQLEQLCARFAAVGRAVCGEPYACPRVIFWNLRGNTCGYPAAADTPNTQMLSGYSPSLLKLVLMGADLVGDEVEVEEVLADGTTVKKLVREGPTPAQTVRAALDDEAFDVVRLALSGLGKGALAAYVFEKDGFEIVEDAGV